MLSRTKNAIFPAVSGLHTFLAGVVLLFATLPLQAQLPEGLKGEEEAVAVCTFTPNAALLEVAAQPAQFVIIQSIEVSKIITYHPGLTAEALPGTIELFNANGDFSLGIWNATAQSAPNGGVFWVVQINSTVPPGKYRILDSDPGTWATCDAVNQRGVVWVLKKKAESL